MVKIDTGQSLPTSVLNVMRQSACLVLNLITVDGYAATL